MCVRVCVHVCVFMCVCRFLAVCCCFNSSMTWWVGTVGMKHGHCGCSTAPGSTSCRRWTQTASTRQTQTASTVLAGTHTHTHTHIHTHLFSLFKLKFLFFAAAAGCRFHPSSSIQYIDYSSLKELYQGYQMSVRVCVYVCVCVCVCVCV